MIFIYGQTEPPREVREVYLERGACPASSDAAHDGPHPKRSEDMHIKDINCLSQEEARIVAARLLTAARVVLAPYYEREWEDITHVIKRLCPDDREVQVSAGRLIRKRAQAIAAEG